MAAVKVGVLFMWTSLFQGDTSDLILSLEENGGKRQRKCGFPGLPGGSGGCVLIRRLTLRQQLVKHVVEVIPTKASELEMGGFCLLPASSVPNPGA